MALKPSVNLHQEADALCCILNALNAAKAHGSKYSQDWLLSILRHAIRQLERFFVPEVSFAAQQQANSMGIGSLRQYRWGDQTTKMMDLGRKIFHWEHIEPVSQVTDALVSLSAVTQTAVLGIISKAEVAWILKSEDAKLNKAGYRNKRPKGGRAAYSAVGIVL